jgi:putative DNA primase/helicase
MVTTGSICSPDDSRKDSPQVSKSNSTPEETVPPRSPVPEEPRDTHANPVEIPWTEPGPSVLNKPNPLLDAALAYAARGWPVVPNHGSVDGRCTCGRGPECRTPGKHPRTEHGYKDATTDPAAIQEWWARDLTANVGVATGRASGLLVIDIDAKNGGFTTLEELQAELGTLPPTVKCLTGGGGQHLYFKRPPINGDIISAPHGLGRGVDVRADGAQVISPPSSHACGGRYEWAPGQAPGEITLAELPPAWLGRLPKRVPPGQHEGQSHHSTSAAAPKAAPLTSEDHRLLYAARTAENGEKFSALWRGDDCNYPSASEADAALCSMLAFWTNKDATRIDRLFRHSGRMREKWVEIHDGVRTYGAMTVDFAIANCKDGYSPRSSSRESDRDATKLEAARALIDRLLAEKKGNLLAKALESESVGLLAHLREHDLAAFERGIAKLRDSGVKAADVQRIDRVVGSRIKQNRDERKRLQTEARQQAHDDTRASRVADELPDAPVPDGTIVPAGWTVDRFGVARLNLEDEGPIRKQVLATPVVITRRLLDIQSGLERVELGFVRDGAWRKVVAKRSVASVARQIIELADYGLPITSNNAPDAVQYLADFEAANMATLPLDRVSSQMGWVADGFLWGGTYLRPDEANHGGVPVGPQSAVVTFCGEDVGDGQRAKGLRAEGSLDVWKQAIALAANYPRVMLALYAAFAAPLLVVLDVVNFVVNLCGPSTIGKTTSLRLAASAWGDPDERRPGAFLLTWDATPVFVERTACVLSSLPFVIDDTRKVKDSSAVEAVIYRVASGQGRGRGSVKGTRETLTFYTVMISSGEEPVVGYAREGGAHARVITLWGPPFEKADADTGKLVVQLNQAVRANFGHAGPAVVRYLLDRRGSWPVLKHWFRRKILAKYQAKAGTNAVLGRYAEYFAVLDLAARIAHRVLDLPWDPVPLLDTVWGNLGAAAEQVDQAAAAMRLVQSWAVGHESEFDGRNTSTHPPSAGWAGRWEKDPAWDRIAILPHKLKQILDEGGHQMDATARAWRDRGWLITDPDRLKKRIRLKDAIPWAYVITRAAFDGVQ